MKVTIEVEITEEQIENLIVNAIEGGSNYWMLRKEVEVLKEGFVWDSGDYAKSILNEKCQIPVYDLEEPETKLGVINKIHIQKAFELMALDVTGRKAIMDAINETDDSDTADIFMQFVVMGEIIYG